MLSIHLGADVIEEVISEYPPEYCTLLELAYGEGMMSEGGFEGIEHMFEGVELAGKRALDIGSGLGGVAIYLAATHGMQVTGLDVNPWMIEDATKRIPDDLVGMVEFRQSLSNEKLDFPDGHFDIVYSKGVLCHVDDKMPLFRELLRVLKPGGQLVINDWISKEAGQWGENVGKLVELEGLTLFAHTEDQYIEWLQEAGFDGVAVRDDAALYCHYNQDIVDRHPQFRDQLSEQDYQDSVEGYTAIARAQELGEARTLRFTARRD